MKRLSIRSILFLVPVGLLLAGIILAGVMTAGQSTVKDEKQYSFTEADSPAGTSGSASSDDTAAAFCQTAGEVLEAALEAAQQMSLSGKGILPGGAISDIMDENSIYALVQGNAYTDCPDSSSVPGFVVTVRSDGRWAQLLISSYTADAAGTADAGAIWFRIKKDGAYGLWSKIKCQTNAAAGNAAPRMFVKANSILIGSVWKLNASTGKVEHDHHPSAWGNAPYSVIAQALGVTTKNVNRNILHSSTGLLYDPNGASYVEEGNATGSFLDNIIGNSAKNIAAADISAYDYMLTHFWRGDLSFPIGSESSTAGDGSLVGGVLSLLSYMRARNPSCRLVLVSAPPVDAALNDGDNPFTRQYNGQTIAQLDSVMRTIAERERFLYLDFQGMELSYH